MDTATGPQGQQHYLHDLVCLVRAQACALSGVDGQILADRVQGVFVPTGECFRN